MTKENSVKDISLVCTTLRWTYAFLNIVIYQSDYKTQDFSTTFL